MFALLIIGATICCVVYMVNRHPKEGAAQRETAALQQEVEGLHAELDGVRQELSELAERVDFAERMLAKQREGDRGDQLAPPKA